jgi:hypothetical protein
MARSFDYQRFKANWRKACAQHGIDPDAGATVYQAANVLAERRKDERRGSSWWQRDHSAWDYAPTYRSYVEQVALFRVFAQAFLAWANAQGRTQVVCNRRLRRLVERLEAEQALEESSP